MEAAHGLCWFCFGGARAVWKAVSSRTAAALDAGLMAAMLELGVAADAVAISDHFCIYHGLMLVGLIHCRNNINGCSYEFGKFTP